MFRKALIFTIMVTLFTNIAFAAETITKNNFAEPIIQPNLKDYYLPGDKISFNLTIEPKTADDYTLVDGRLYEFNTSLVNPSLEVSVEYEQGPLRIYNGEDYIRADVKNWDYGLKTIIVEVSGEVPTVNSRIGNVIALGIDIQDAEDNAIEPVILKVINESLFTSYIHDLESTYSELDSRTTQLEKKGLAVAEIRIKLDSAKIKIDDGKKYFENKKYGEANSTLVDAEKYLNEAYDLIRWSEISLELSSTKEKIETMFTKMSEFELLINELKSKGESTLSYEIKLQSFKQKYTEFNSRIAQAEDYLNKKLYDESLNVINELNSQIEDEISSLDSSISEISSLLKPPTKEEETPTPEPTPTSPPISERISDFFSGVSNWFSENRERILLYGGSVVVLAIIGFVGYKGFKSYMRKRKWDELK